MERLFLTNRNDNVALIARVALGIVIFPHGAQKLLGWFGGFGFDGTMGYFTETLGIPWVLALLVILVEFFGSLFLMAGLATRIAAFGVIGIFIGIVATSHTQSGFFMNWSGQANQLEGLEYFILVFGLAFISLIAGGGKASVDARLLDKTSREAKAERKDRLRESLGTSRNF